MPKLLYLTVWDFKDASANGICKKIFSHVKTLKDMGFHVDFAYTSGGKVFLESGEKKTLLGIVPASLNVFLAHKVFVKFLKKRKYDAIYIRHCPINPFYLHLLSVLRKNCTKIVVEFPTYPYQDELRGSFKLLIGRCFDQSLRGKMKKYVDRIVTYSQDEQIFGIPTIKTINGIDFSSIKKTAKEHFDGSVHLIGVAMLAPWHGYDRIIEGLYNYYHYAQKRVQVKFHIVGEGSELAKYQEMVKQWELEPFVKFYGNRVGKELDEIYQKADIAVSSLGLHRIGLMNASPLKTREYGARGLAMVAVHPIDFLLSDSKYVYIVPADESPIEIEKIVNFYNSLSASNGMSNYQDKIRESARKVADMPITFEPIKKYYMEE